MNTLKILVVDDDKLEQKVMLKSLAGQEVDVADDYRSALRKLNAGHYDICFFDLLLGKNDNYSGLKLIPAAVEKGAYPVVMSSCETEETINRAYALGCRDFYVKGNEDSNIAAVIARYLRGGAGSAQDIFSSGFITDDPSTRSMIIEALKYAPAALPILLLGPSGTGKTTLAKIIHDNSGRQGDFVAINCSAYSEDLLEAELFGYKKGAFTGAHDNRKGRLLQADKGTLFLDEIGAMSQSMQTKLLKAIEEKCFYPVGSDRPEYSDFRVISATLEDMQQLLAQKKLRFDFFQRVHGMTITLKPLEQRKCDVFPLINAFCKTGKRLAFDDDAKQYLLRHNWPGNTREVKRFVELVSAGGEGRITKETAHRHIKQVVSETQQPAGDFLTQQQYDFALKHGLNEALDRFAYEAIKRNLDENKGKKVRTRGDLKIATRLLYSMLRKYGGK
ncbi:MAG: sigma 54-interacting transcriptional regulator [Elusimicrobiales bacterium]